MTVLKTPVVLVSPAHAGIDPARSGNSEGGRLILAALINQERETNGSG